jgi:hypothetical protein
MSLHTCWWDTHKSSSHKTTFPSFPCHDHVTELWLLEYRRNWHHSLQPSPLKSEPPSIVLSWNRAEEEESAVTAFGLAPQTPSEAAVQTYHTVQHVKNNCFLWSKWDLQAFPALQPARPLSTCLQTTLRDGSTENGSEGHRLGGWTKPICSSLTLTKVWLLLSFSNR